ncbi:expressed protein [Echinococcus multilocularis]|uniref:Expressed protein n=1 Tax=Echinococcus multilocularis TaxID=6211 RepID=A0A068YF52_ECHMU|nr:expressed protein [Echinococcus multilocularis]
MSSPSVYDIEMSHFLRCATFDHPLFRRFWKTALNMLIFAVEHPGLLLKWWVSKVASLFPGAYCGRKGVRGRSSRLLIKGENPN